MAPHLRKDSKKESCFELISQDRRSYEVSRPHGPASLAFSLLLQVKHTGWRYDGFHPLCYPIISPPDALLLPLLCNAFSSPLLLCTSQIPPLLVFYGFSPLLSSQSHPTGEMQPTVQSFTHTLISQLQSLFCLVFQLVILIFFHEIQNKL